jgi:hypothetical protein
VNVHFYDALVHERMRDAEEAAERFRRIREARSTSTKRPAPVRVELVPRHEELEAEQPVLAGHR